MDLAQRAVACKGWRWMPGMLVTGHGRIVGDGLHVVDQMRDLEHTWLTDESMFDPLIERTSAPDLTDPATMGCLLALVREAWPGMCVSIEDVSCGHQDVYEVHITTKRGTLMHFSAGPCLGGRLVAALEAAP